MPYMAGLHGYYTRLPNCTHSHKLGPYCKKFYGSPCVSQLPTFLFTFIIISYKLWKISSISIQHWPVKIFVVLCVSFSITNSSRSEAYKNKIKLWKDRKSVIKMFVRPSSLSHSGLSIQVHILIYIHPIGYFAIQSMHFPWVIIIRPVMSHV